MKHLYKTKLIQMKFIHININCVHLTAGCCLTIMGRKNNYSIVKISLTHIWCSFLYDFVMSIMDCLLSNPTATFHCEKYYSRPAMANNFLSFWTLYSNIPSGLPRLDYLGTMIGNSSLACHLKSYCQQ